MMRSEGTRDEVERQQERPWSVVVVAPVYRDWDSAALLCKALDEVSSQIPTVQLRILLVDDGSPDRLQGWEPFTPVWIWSIEVLWLRRNLGHQRAIAAGLCYIHENAPCDTVVVMDADGEDRPKDAVYLIQRSMETPEAIIFAERRKRVETLLFRTGYQGYRLLHRVLTGVPVRVGNFSVLPFLSLKRLVCMSELWNHYAGAVFKSKLRFGCIPIDRGMRYRGQSRMNLISLFNHGLSGIASFNDAVASRILIASVACTLAVLAALLSVLAVRLFTALAIPGWATYASGLLLILLTQCAAISFSLVFTLIVNRTNAVFLPERDYGLFVDEVEVLIGRSGESNEPHNT